MPHDAGAKPGVREPRYSTLTIRVANYISWRSPMTRGAVRREGDRMQRARFWSSVVVAVVVGLGGLGGAAAHAAPAVMILYFDNDTGDPSFDPLGKGLAELG